MSATLCPATRKGNGWRGARDTVARCSAFDHDTAAEIFSVTAKGFAVITVTMTSREFEQDIPRAKTLAEYGPVVITDQDRPTHALLSIAVYRRLTSPGGNIVDRLAMPIAAGVDIEFDPPRFGEACRGSAF